MHVCPTLRAGWTAELPRCANRQQIYIPDSPRGRIQFEMQTVSLVFALADTDNWFSMTRV